MSDLGLNFFNRKNTAAETEQISARTFRQDSSSTSSVIAGDENSASSGDTPSGNTFINFGILRNDDEDEPSRTRQLFPAAGLGEKECFSGSKLFPGENLANATGEGGSKQWLNLSCYSDSGGTPNPTNVSGAITKQGIKKSRRGPKSRSSQYRGVTFYRRTGRWESHIWDCGKQIYLGGFDTSYAAARAYDRAALKFRGLDADINFQVADYKEDVKKTKNLSKEEFVQILRRESNGFGRGSSRYKGLNLSLQNSCNIDSGSGHLLGNKEWNVATIKHNHRDNDQEQDLELSLKVSSSENADVKQQQEVYLTMAAKNPNLLTTPVAAASSGFPHYINMHNLTSTNYPPFSWFNT